MILSIMTGYYVVNDTYTFIVSSYYIFLLGFTVLFFMASMLYFVFEIYNSRMTEKTKTSSGKRPMNIFVNYISMCLIIGILFFLWLVAVCLSIDNSLILDPVGRINLIFYPMLFALFIRACCVWFLPHPRDTPRTQPEMIPRGSITQQNRK